MTRTDEPQITLNEACRDPELFGKWFVGASWRAWFAFLATLFALPLDKASREIFERCTGRSQSPEHPAREAYLICGRRSGKSFIMALVAVYFAVFRDWRPYLQIGERATIIVVAADRRQARTVFRFASGFLQNVPMLARLIEAETQERIDLNNGVSIEIQTASFRRIRGLAVPVAILDEAAFFPTDDAAEPDEEIVAAIKPAMAQFAQPLLLVASSPYTKRGILWRASKEHYGKDGDPILVWKAPTAVMNPSIDPKVIEDAYALDAARAAAEYGAEFRSDIDGFIDAKALASVVDDGVRERVPNYQHSYRAFVDPSGGSSDSMTLGIAHREGVTVILDCVREIRSPFNPEAVVEEFAALLKRYRIASVGGDRYAGEWVASQFRKHGIYFEPSERSKSEIYGDTLPLINSGGARLLDHDRMTAQFLNLERRTKAGGREVIDHAPGGHDDVANAAAGALLRASKQPGMLAGEIYAYGVPMSDPLAEYRTGYREPEGDREPLRAPVYRGHVTVEEIFARMRDREQSSDPFDELS